MTLAELLPLARKLGSAERLVLAEEMLESVGGEDAVDDDVLDLVALRVERARANPAEAMAWAEAEAAMDAEFGEIR